MNNIPAQAATGWGGATHAPSRPDRTRLRDVLPPIVAVAVLTLASFAYGAVQPIAALTLSGALTILAVVSMLAAGPRHVTLGMLIGAGVIVVAGATGLAGPLFRSGSHLAVLFAAGAAWCIGFIAARHRNSLDAAWTALLWGSIAYCTWMFFSDVAAASSDQANAVTDSFETPANAAVLFGLFSVIGLSRVLHVVKQMEADALPPAQMVERLLRDGLAGLLLLVLALTCLAMAGSRVGMIITSGVLLGHAWWDLFANSRARRGLMTRLAAFVLPLSAIGLVAWGVSLGWLNDETIAPGIGGSETLPNLQRITAYMGAWSEQPAFGHGLGSISVVAAEEQTLFNAKAMLAPGGAHNVFVTWLTEGGVAGLALLVLALAAMHARIFGALGARRIPRTFLKLAVVASTLLLIHGVTDSSLDVPGVTWLYAFLLGSACGVASGGKSAGRTEATAGRS